MHPGSACPHHAMTDDIRILADAANRNARSVRATGGFVRGVYVGDKETWLHAGRAPARPSMNPSQKEYPTTTQMPNVIHTAITCRRFSCSLYICAERCILSRPTFSVAKSSCLALSEGRRKWTTGIATIARRIVKTTHHTTDWFFASLRASDSIS